MALVVEHIQTDGIAELSYGVGDDSQGVAAVFDPRPDVDCYLQLARGQAKKLAEQQFHTLRDFYLKLDDGVIIYPAHGHGSPCGADIGDRLNSTMGYERRFNAFLQFEDVKSFTEYALSTAPPAPAYYPRMKKLNAKGPKVLGNLPAVRGLPPKSFKEAIDDDDNVLIDTRMMLAFGGGHIKGALSIGGSPMLSIWAGWLLDARKPILLVLESDEKLEEVVRLFLRTGYTKFAGYLVGGMRAWDNAGLPLEEVGQMTVHEIKRAGKRLQLLDVRSPDEWKGGHIPNAHHIFLGELREKIGQLKKTKPTAVYCDSGYRASIASSILKREGFGCVCNVPGNWQAWKKAGFPVDGEIEKTKAR